MKKIRANKSSKGERTENATMEFYLYGDDWGWGRLYGAHTCCKVTTIQGRGPLPLPLPLGMPTAAPSNRN